MEFGEKMKFLLKQKGVSQKEFALKVGMNYSHANKFFLGRSPSLDFITKVVEVFPDVNLNWLLFPDKVEQDPDRVEELGLLYETDKALDYLQEIEDKVSKLREYLTQK